MCCWGAQWKDDQHRLPNPHHAMRIQQPPGNGMTRSHISHTCVQATEAHGPCKGAVSLTDGRTTHTHASTSTPDE